MAKFCEEWLKKLSTFSLKEKWRHNSSLTTEGPPPEVMGAPSPLDSHFFLGWSEDSSPDLGFALDDFQDPSQLYNSIHCIYKVHFSGLS